LLVLVGIGFLTEASFVDRVCKLSSDPGKKCPPGDKQGEEDMFYFDSSPEKCVAFKYLGCEGNENKFESTEDCNDSCKTPWFIKKNKAAEKAGKDKTTHEKSDCALDADPGNCKALITMWTFNSKTKVCEVFGYGGCGGNGNRFDTRGECENFCNNS